MATSSSHNAAADIIYCELQSINEEYDHPFTPKQVDIIVKFISTDYDDRCVRVRPDIASRYFDNIPQFLAFGYLNQFLEKLSQNTPLSMVEKHVDIFSFLIRELKGYFVGAAWLDKMEALVRGNETYAEELEANEKKMKEIFNDHLKSIKEEKEKMLGELQVRKIQLNCSVEEGSDEAFAEYLQNSEMIKGVFEKEIKDVEATIMEILSEMKPALDTGAKVKLASLEFDIFSPTIIREKKVTRSTSTSSEKTVWLEMLDNY
ncbi:unnamed protein product [Trifolium pratense]|uniref:Uncharacterized protein n=1 Tax=Trifolium pratense TaxID=57577 RepID=A0ACB0ICV0_TRIPR|nr:unnamed protein product [Trifolium pratense]